MRLSSGLTGVICSISLTSCMVGPNFHTPEPPQTDSYTPAPAPKKTTSIASIHQGGQAQYFVAGKNVPTEWWKLFHSESLNGLIEAGLDNSPNLAAAQAALRQAQETYNEQLGFLMFPAVSGQYSGERQRSVFPYFSSPSSALYNLYNASVNVTYTLDVFGGSRRQLESLRSQVDYQKFQLEAAYLTLTANIVTTAVTAASLDAQIQATNHLVKIENDQVDIVKKQFRLGGASGADVLAQESQLAQTRATLPPLEQKLAQANHALAVLVGDFPSERQIPRFDLNKLHLPTALPVTLPSMLVRDRPDIRASEALLHVASAQVGVATANLFPQITLNGGYGWQSTLPGGGNLFQKKYNTWSFGGTLLQPIFNGGGLIAEKRAAVAAFDEARAQYQEVVLQAFQNVADTLRALQHDAETLKAEKDAETAAYGSLKIAEDQYRLGGVSYVNLLIANRQYQLALIGRIQAQAVRYNDTAALFQALGGGWWRANE
jgi:NodT family efflux transporter outer membrane factor (OMF) lipoprotein